MNYGRVGLTETVDLKGNAMKMRKFAIASGHLMDADAVAEVRFVARGQALGVNDQGKENYAKEATITFWLLDGRERTFSEHEDAVGIWKRFREVCDASTEPELKPSGD